MKRNHKTYLILLLLPLFFAGILLLASYLFLSRAGEFLTTDEIVSYQAKSKGVYVSALHSMSFNYKLSLYNHLKPKVVAFGSSRVMQFSGESFSVPFANLGSISGPVEALKMLNDNLEHHKPELVIFGVDMWWFNENHPEPASIPHHNRHIEKIDPSLSLLLKPSKWLLKGQLSLSDIPALIDKQGKNLGVYGRLRNDGYDHFGRYHYNSTYTGIRRSDDYEFKASLAKAKAGHKIYSYGDQISPERVEQFEKLLNRFKEENIKVILFLPPMAITLLEYMEESGKFNYINDVANYLSNTGLEFYNYHDPRSIGSNDCEFVDGHHGGAVTYMRLLLDMSLRSNSPLNAMINDKDIAQKIEENSGYASSPHNNEIDFLNLKCSK